MVHGLNKFLNLSLLPLVLFISLFIFSPAVSAQSTASPAAVTNYQPLTANEYLPASSPNYATMAIYNFSHAVSCILIGQSPIAPCLEYRMYKDAQGMIRSTPYLSNTNTSNGVLGVSMSMIGQLISTPPIRSSEFLANLGEQVGIKSAHAQVGGSGSGVLAPIFKLWEVSRNISYLFMIVIFIAVGFMVMFRQKLNPQTVVSIQMALPGMVIGLVAITFSYFLASLISDVAFVGTNVVGYYFSLAQDPPPKTITQLPLIAKSTSSLRPGQEENVLSIFSRYTNIINWSNSAQALVGTWDYLADDDPSRWPVFGRWDAQRALTVLSSMLAIQFVLPYGGLFGGVGQFISGSILGGVTLKDPIDTASWGIAFIAMLILIYSMFKLLLRLIQNFLSIIFLTIASPFYFLATSLPGRQSLIPNWFFNMLCNVLAFPAVFAVFYFVAFILGKVNDPLFEVTKSTSLVGGSTFPLLGGFDLNFLNALLAFGALVASPSIPDIICRTVGRPGQLGAIAAGAVGGAVAAGQRYQGQGQSGGAGFAQNIGNLRDQPFRFSREDPSNPNRILWEESRLPMTGIGTPTPGTITRVTTSTGWRAAGNLIGKARTKLGI